MKQGKARYIAVIMGGTCGERDVSLETGTCVVRNLREAGHKVLPVCIHPDGQWEAGGDFGDDPGGWFIGKSSPALEIASDLASAGIECVFNGLHGPGGEDGTIQGFLRFVGLPFTGPDVAPAALTMDKALTKAVLMNAGVSTPRGFSFPPAAAEEPPGPLRAWVEEMSSEMDFPWIVKPNCLGSSVGIELLRSAEELLGQVEEKERHWRPVSGLCGSGFLIEEVIGGRELTCGVLEIGREGAVALPPIEIRPVTSEFFDYEAKYTPGATEEICPAPLDETTSAAVAEMALRVHHLFHCDPLSRTDMFLDAAGDLVVLEVNTLPGMTATSLIPQSALEAGFNLPDLFDKLTRHGIARETMRKAAETP